MAEHEHYGPNSWVVRHNHQHGEVRHDHGTMKGFAADRWTWTMVCPDCGQSMDWDGDRWIHYPTGKVDCGE